MENLKAKQIVLEQIKDCEARLINAFKVNDLLVFDELLHDDLLFNLPNGQTITKVMDMESHCSGNLVISSMAASEQVIRVMDDHAVVCVTIDMTGSYLNQLIDEKFRYQRIWKLVGTNWKIIAGSCIELKG
ncbi:MAG: hypothetical protein JWN56_2009 [Sphingobacteriales bacterium]|nr:hypothetical protein [Sphingobacteriales bacterium]